MNSVLMFVLIAITVFMTFSNIRRMRQYKKDKTYIDIYTKILRGTEGAYDELIAYIEKEEDPCLKAKSKLIKLYEDVKLGNDVSELQNEDFVSEIFYTNDIFVKEKLTLNSEVFMWYILILSRCRSLSLIDVMDAVYGKVEAHKDDLNNFIEYQCFKSAYEVLLEKNNDSIEFLKKLLAGDYKEYSYDKNLIGIYKKVAASLLSYAGEIVDESDELLISDFTTTLLGNRFTKDLEIYDKYAPKIEEPVEENKEETSEDKVEVEETKEVETTDEVKEEPKEDNDNKE